MRGTRLKGNGFGADPAPDAHGVTGTLLPSPSGARGLTVGPRGRRSAFRAGGDELGPESQGATSEQYRFADVERRLGDNAVPAESPGLSTLLGMGAVIAAQLAAGFALGWLVDTMLGTKPVFLLVGLLLGIVGAVSYTVAQFRKHLKN